MTKSMTLRAAVALALGLAATTPSFAEDPALKAEIEALRAQMEAQSKALAEQQARLEELTRKLAASAETPAPAKSAARSSRQPTRLAARCGSGWPWRATCCMR